MYKRIILLTSFAMMATLGWTQPDRVNNAFTYGEKVTYTVRYNLYFNVNVGELTVNIADEPTQIAKHSCFQITAEGKTYSFYDKIFKVRDRYETFMDIKKLVPVVFIRNVDEGGFKFDEYVIFNQKANKAKSKKRIQKVPAGTQDLLSVLYHARNLDYKNAKTGDKFMLDVFIDDSAYHCGVKFIKREKITTSMGTFNAIKLQPILIVDRIFKSEEDMTLWVTDDENRLPLRVESGISVGKVQMELASYSGLKNPMTSRIK